ncbi:MAG: hypothetical protein JETCAE01_35830 [Anaerolineaceae bacterium]|nr:MAG: hypothetical protein JETCAE01_35830 [Anaerolineaceae bacterium]
MRTLINWKIYFILLIAAVLSSLVVLPYALALQPGIQTDISTLIIQQIIQGGAIFAVMIFLGMILMKRIGLSTPILDLVTKGESAS